eukprot:TRINITY_DN14608_c0_g1_i1.p1 TRINITY_DN14608_c0_g1~~TRINITY_DN14608_c0_g1_i1.p1  ORF type:complete len:234 (+),score=29.92 TRINITY_DN14608_c0_g1_i1:44-745(+)
MFFCDFSTFLNTTGIVFGSISTVIWLICQLPQIYLNFKNKSSDGLSPFMLLFWTIADSCSFFSLLLNGGIVTQFILIVYWLMLDFILDFQYFIFGNDNTKKFDEKSGYTRIENTFWAAIVLFVVSLFSTISSFIETHKLEVGLLLAYFSSLCYAFSRISQIVKNFRGKSVEGIEIKMFILAFFGNLTYGLSLVVHVWTKDYILKQIPWLIGSWGVMVLDFIIFLQYRHYSVSN